MNLIKKIVILLLVFVWACDSEISEDQSDYFIKYYGTYLNDMSSKVYPTNDGGIIIIGTAQLEVRKNDIVLIKTDKFGNQVSWSPRYFGGEDDDYGRDLLVLDDGYLIIGSKTDNVKRDLDSYIARLDDQGNILWEGNYGKLYDDEAMSIVQKQDGGYIFAGYSTNSQNQKKVYIQPVNSDGEPLPSSERGERDEQIIKLIEEDPTTFLTIGTKLGSDQQFFVLKVNSVGNDFANNSFGIDGRNEIASDAVFSNDESALFIVGTSYENNVSNGEIYLTRINSEDLTEEWAKRISINGISTGNAISFMGDDKLLIAGESQVLDDKNIIIYIVDFDGNVINSFEYGGSGDQTPSDVYYLNNQIIVLGNNLYEGNSMITLMKIDEDGNLWN